MKQFNVLFDPQSRDQWTGGKALEPVARDRCPQCLGSLRSTCTTEMALFRHGGYGAWRETTVVSCERCGWSLVAEVSEIRPDREVA